MGMWQPLVQIEKLIQILYLTQVEARLKGVKLQILHYTTMVLVYISVYFPHYFLNYYRILHRCLPPYKLE